MATDWDSPIELQRKAEEDVILDVAVFHTKPDGEMVLMSELTEPQLKQLAVALNYQMNKWRDHARNLEEQMLKLERQLESTEAKVN